MAGYFYLQRGLFDHPIFKTAQPLSKREAWIWVIEHANFEPSKYRFQSNVYDVARGDLATSYRALARDWSWSVDRVIRELKTWAGQGMVELETRHGYVQLTVCNYAKYQDKRNADATPPRQPRDADATATSTNQRKERKERNESNSYTADFDAFWLAYPRHDCSKAEASKAYQSAIRTGVDHGRIIDGTEAFRGHVTRTGMGQRFIPHAATWLNQRRWEADYGDARPYLDGKPADAPKQSAWLAEGDRLAAKYRAEADRERQGAADPHAG